MHLKGQLMESSHVVHAIALLKEEEQAFVIAIMR